MPSQNFFSDKDEKASVVVVKDYVTQQPGRGPRRRGIYIAAAVGLCLAAAVGLWAFLQPTPPVESDFSAPAPAPTETPASETSVEPTPDPIPREDWYLRLVNAENPLPEDYGEQDMTSFGGGYYFDERVIEPLNGLLDAAEEEGLNLRVISGYRSVTRQTERHEDKVREYLDEDYSEEEAEELASREEPTYRESEHSLGLAVDFSDGTSSAPRMDFAETEEYQWLLENAADYGFILRYPEDKTQETGMNYQPWHFRYVTSDHAKVITEEGICLEEYLALP